MAIRPKIDCRVTVVPVVSKLVIYWSKWQCIYILHYFSAPHHWPSAQQEGHPACKNPYSINPKRGPGPAQPGEISGKTGQLNWELFWVQVLWWGTYCRKLNPAKTQLELGARYRIYEQKEKSTSSIPISKHHTCTLIFCLMDLPLHVHQRTASLAKELLESTMVWFWQAQRISDINHIRAQHWRQQERLHQLYISNNFINAEHGIRRCS